MKYNIIGMGNIGMRYLQSIVSGDKEHVITCYDIMPNFKDRVVSFLNENQLPSKAIHFSASIEKNLEEVDSNTIVLITTTADDRESLILDFAMKNPKLIITEKLVCNSRTAYSGLLKSLEKINYKNILVNFFPRNQLFFQDLYKHINKNQKFDMHVSIPKLGLACNGIHFIDMFLWLSDSLEYKISKTLYHETYQQKRKGYYDFSGSINVVSNLSTLTLSDDYTEGDQLISFYYNNIIYHFFMIREFAVKVENNDTRIINYPLNHVSEYIFTEIHSFLNEGKSNLPNIFDSYSSHSVLFDFIEKNKLTNLKIT
jgi:hypothetical protein